MPRSLLRFHSIRLKRIGVQGLPWGQHPLFFANRSLLAGLLLAVLMGLSGMFFRLPTVAVSATTGNLCTQPLDMVLIIDRSGSMENTSRCDWWGLSYPAYEWTQYITYNESQSWCNAKNQTVPHQSIWTNIDPKKIVAAKDAANNFLSLMGANDQSGLISYATTATLNKGLSGNHVATQSAVTGLITGGATNIGDAIVLGIQELGSSRMNPQANHAMILLTDGKANKPNGNGSDENAADTAYAVAKATEAASHGYKIFTIGLGDDQEVNAVMLQDIATITGAQYYHSPAQTDLQEIYNSIASRLCLYGSISGCKYSDNDKDGVISGQDKIAGWEIILNNSANYTQLTDSAGCFQFSGLLPGAYILSEGGKNGVSYEQTYPPAGTYTIDLAEGQNITNQDFGNYLPVCGNNLVDTQFGEACEINQTQSCSTEADQTGTQSCKQDCSGWNECVAADFCGDGQKNNGEECDGTDGVPAHYSCTASCTLEYIPYCGDQIVNQSSEQCDANTEACTTSSGYSGTRQCTAECLLADCVSTQFCGDGTTDDPETCDDGASNGQAGYCNSDCTGQTPPVCGNSLIETGETCDDGQNNGSYGYCNTSCNGSTLAVCGNSVIEGSEICDEGSLNGTLGHCNSVCSGQSTATDQNVISGFKYQDNDGLASTTNDYIGLSGWLINLFSSANTTTPLYSATTSEVGYYEFINLAAGNYSLTENLLAGWAQLLSPGSINLSGTSTVSANNNFVNYFASTEPVCGNSLVETGESCDDGSLNGTLGHCNSTCSGQTPIVCGDSVCSVGETCSSCATDCGVCDNGGGGGGGGGGGLPPGLIIFNEASINVTETSAVVTWQTNHFSTTRLIYAAEDEPHLFDLLVSPNYGYAHSSVEIDQAPNGVTFHTVVLTGLTPNTNYYYHAISHASPDTVGGQYAFKTLGSSQPTPALLPPSIANDTPTLPDAPVVSGILATAPLNLALNSTGDLTTELAPLILDNNNTGQVAGATESTCRPLSIWNIILLILAYILVLLSSYYSKKHRYLPWVTVILLSLMPIIALIYCASWSWVIWLSVIFLYVATILFYRVYLSTDSSKKSKYILVVVTATLLLAWLWYVMSICYC